MGNVSSHLPDSSLKNIPPHLRPIRRTRSLKKALAAEKARRGCGGLKEKAAGDKKKEKKPVVNMESSGITDNDYEQLTSYEQKADSKWLKGRKFHDVKESRYLLPNDARELERLRMESYVLKWAFSKNYVAPLDELLTNGAKVLDLGCGPGNWIIDMATDFPASTFVGIDMCDVWPKPSPHSVSSPGKRNFTISHSTSLDMPKSSPNSQDMTSHSEPLPLTSSTESTETYIELPSNLSFRQVNILEGLPYEDGEFDFVHQRCFQHAYTKKQWASALDDIVRVTKPGGWVELMEIDPQGKRLGPTTEGMLLKMTHAIQAREIDPGVAESLKELLASAGMVDVQTSMVSIPAGEWGLELGHLWVKNLHELIESMKPWLSKSFSMKSNEYDQVWVQVTKEFEQHQSFFNAHVAWARKPEAGVPITTHWESCQYVHWHQLSGTLATADFSTAVETDGSERPVLMLEAKENVGEKNASQVVVMVETKGALDAKRGPKTKFKQWQGKIVDKYLGHGLGLKEVS